MRNSFGDNRTKSERPSTFFRLKSLEERLVEGEDKQVGREDPGPQSGGEAGRPSRDVGCVAVGVKGAEGTEVRVEGWQTRSGGRRLARCWGGWKKWEGNVGGEANLRNEGSLLKR